MYSLAKKVQRIGRIPSHRVAALSAFGIDLEDFYFSTSTLPRNPLNRHSFGSFNFFFTRVYYIVTESGFLLDWEIHSQKELAHCTVHVMVQNYACCFGGWLRHNFRTAFILSDRLHISTWPVKSNKNVWMTKITGVEMMATSDGLCLLLRCSDAHQWVYLRGHVTQMTSCMIVKWRYTPICLRWW